MGVTGEVLVGRSRDTDSVTQLCFVRQSNGDDGTKTVSKEVSSASTTRFGGVVNTPFLEILWGVFELGDKSDQEETDQEGYGGRTEEKEKMPRCKRRQEKAAGRRLEERRRGRKNEMNVVGTRSFR